MAEHKGSHQESIEYDLHIVPRVNVIIHPLEVNFVRKPKEEAKEGEKEGSGV